jgi:uncharacterized membrane protein
VGWVLLPLLVGSPLTGLALAFGISFTPPLPRDGRPPRDAAPPALMETLRQVAARPNREGRDFVRQRGGSQLVRVLDSSGTATTYRVTAAGLERLPRNWPRLLHEGNWGGLLGSLANALAGLGMAGLLVTGVLIWARRKLRLRQMRAARLDEGRWAMLVATLGAALASLAAVMWEIAAAPTPVPPATLALAFGTILLSWIFVHVLFAAHYAHEHWLSGTGIAFPGNDRPDFLEFLYFGFTIGMTFQVSDACTQTPPMRRLVLVHAVVSFLFNAVILAAAVNLVSGLLR